MLRTGKIVDWIRSKLEEPPVDPAQVNLENEPPDDFYDQLEQEYCEQNRLPSAAPAEEGGKSASVVRPPFVSELAERDITDPRVREWIDEEYRRMTGVSIGTEKTSAPPARSTRDAEAVGESYQCSSCGHGNENGTVALAERKLRVRRPWLRKKGTGKEGEVPVPAYEAMQRDGRLSSRMLEILDPREARGKPLDRQAFSRCPCSF